MLLSDLGMFVVRWSLSSLEEVFTGEVCAERGLRMDPAKEG